MLKTQVGDELWLVHQPDHARVAGYLAAHWGGINGFARPGAFAPSDFPEKLRQEVVHAIAEHDNGWWEWEAAPDLDPLDHWPRNLPDIGREKPSAGLDRWRLGVPRLADEHPYVALLISCHAWWLYAFAFDNVPGKDDAFRHPIFGAPEVADKLVSDRATTRAFLEEQATVQGKLTQRLQGLPAWASAVKQEHLHPHVRLLQILDAMSLLLCFGATRPLTFRDVPRQAWRDRTSLEWKPAGERRVVLAPFPFDLDPLTVYLPARVIPANGTAPTPKRTPLVDLHATPITTVRIELASM